MIRYAFSKLPPSVNGLFFNKAKGRGKTDTYRAWLDTAGREIMAQGRKHLHGPVSLSIALVRPNKSSDLDNRLKALLDLLVSNSVIDDDSLVQRISIQWVAHGDPCVVLIQAAEQEMAA